MPRFPAAIPFRLLALAMLLALALLTTSSSGAIATANAATAASKAKAKAKSKAKRSKKRKGRATARPPRLTFGIYPGGGAGAVGPSGIPKPEDPEKRLAALKTLRSGKRFVLHLYEDFRTAADADAVPSWMATQVDEATANGFQVEMVLRYRPDAAGGDVSGFTAFVRERVRQYSTNPGVTALQITNEANVTVAPDAADGAYAGAQEALVRGLIAADSEARAAGTSRIKFGFNWANGDGPQEAEFFANLGRIGGAEFAAAVDWVGVDAYPGTWGPKLPSGNLADAVRAATISTMRALRTDLMPRAGLRSASIRFAESGFPTDADRTEAMQLTVLSTAVRTVSRYRRKYGVSDYRWFDLRDADSTFPSFESHYGITRDDYSPKPAFHRYRSLVSQLG